MKPDPCRLYIFTGKGGVGKTTLSKAFVRYLIEHDHEAIYLTFKTQSMSEKSASKSDGTIQTVHQGIKEVALDLEECARNYIEKRLGTKMVASWIVKTPFFKALLNMVPGFNYLIFLGQILEMGRLNPRLIVVLDAPASGHALTMVESTTNFQQIFQKGVIFEDTQKMLSRLNDPTYTKIHIVGLPSVMSWQEAIELRDGLKARSPVEVTITLNNCLFPVVGEQLSELPQGLKEKVEYENKLVQEHLNEIHGALAHSLSTDPQAIELDLVGSLSKLL